MSRKRGNRDGTITKRKDGRWEVRYIVDTLSGPKRKCIYAKTQKEAREKLTQAQANRDRGIIFDAENLTVADYLEQWLGNSVRDSVRPSTFERTKQIVELHLTPRLGATKLEKLNASQVQSLYRDRLDSSLSPATVHKVHAVLHKALEQAVRWSLIPRNVTEATSPPQPNPEEIKPLNKEQARRLLKAAEGDPLEALYLLAVTSGMRQGELLALKWEDIDL